ncbi:hypothetical protein HN695_00315 [Candidatus Woesearchaeota archaeon]|jgi:hypothetical protein|nr:hypothetical protein [Candidatus Woesearchaeota archaeon]MBT5271998.1 hypothetical protein [Candidatus Woesearchaeota archaeon]MBT6041073.1 hypothetical protein [Candidatus Woesearchaeota archaeon]MBT6337089.1 hypothetical protein [Candidatus Woesearchaeota archaeon]MBT7926756.1 hypothetical protein [Candidatus Woesearchaeota archaeon]
MAVELIEKIVKKYKIDVSSTDSFASRFKAYKDFRDPKHQNIERITDEFTEALLGNEAKGTIGILKKPYQKLDELFEYDQITKKVGKKKLKHKDVEKFFDTHIEAFLKKVALSDFEALKKDYAGDEDDFRRELRALYNTVTGRNPNDPRESIDGIIDQFKKNGFDYKTFKNIYKAQIVPDEAKRLKDIAENAISGHLIQSYDRLKIANKVKGITDKHESLTTDSHPLTLTAHQNAETYVHLHHRELLEQVEKKDYRSHLNLQYKE